MTRRCKVLEWSMNNRNTKNELPEWVGDEIAKKDPDIFCLVEWRDNDVNKKMIEKKTGQGYQIEAYDGASYDGAKNKEENMEEDKDQKKIKQSNGILIGIKKEFGQIYEAGNAKYNYCKSHDGKREEKPEESKQGFDEPDWLKVVVKVNNTEELIDIVGFKVRIGGKEKKDLCSRQQQLMFLTGNPDKKDTENPDEKDTEIYNKSKKIFGNLKHKQLLLGDLNYGPHNDEYRSGSGQYNWNTLKEKLWKQDYFNQQKDLNFYTPCGTSYRGKTLDWIITRNVRTIENADYNQLDWSFGKHNKKHPYVDGYFVPENYFIRTDPGYPDHAILTQEIELD